MTSLEWSNIFTETFEGGPFTDGSWADSVFAGSDRSDAEITTRGPSYVGSHTLRIRDGEATSYAITNPIDVSNIEEVDLSFQYQTRSVNAGEQFTIEYRLDQGGSWMSFATIDRSEDVWTHMNSLPTVDVSNANWIEFEFRTAYASNRERLHLDSIVLDGLGPP